MPPHKIYFFTDSQCALTWIKREDKQFKQFIQSRAELVRQHSSAECWHYVPTTCNPSDVATRGHVSDDTFERWLKGPSFVIDNYFPTQPVSFSQDEKLLETVCFNVNVANVPHDPLPTLIVDRFSKYPRLLNVVASVT